MTALQAIARDTTALNLVDAADPAPSMALTPMQMAYQLIARGADLTAVERMLDTADRLAAAEAQRAFNAAFAAFKSEAITVLRTREVADGPLKGRRYAELYSFVNAATPALSKHGLSASWSVTRDEKDWIEVTCTIEHALGGKKSVAQGGPPDNGGAKNALQARISTVTYLERATFKAVCGLAEQGDDDDGAQSGAGSALVNDAQLAKLREVADEVGGDIEKLCAHFKVEALPDLPASKFAEAIGIMELKRRAK